jgi:uncharacterized delta-60 repeat protein
VLGALHSIHIFTPPYSRFSPKHSAVLVLPDDSFLVYDGFVRLNSKWTGALVKFKADGTLDLTFHFSTDYANVSAVTPLLNGQLLVAALHQEKSGRTYYRILRLQASGAIDTTFNAGAGANDVVRGISVQPKDGKVLVGGYFSTFNGTATPYLVRLAPNGPLDTSLGVLSMEQFTPDALSSGSVSPLALGVWSNVLVQAGGKILIGGNFISVNGTAAAGIARLNSNGTVDTSFVASGYDVRTATTAGANGNHGRLDHLPVQALALAPDQTILAGGAFRAPSSSPANAALIRLATTGALSKVFPSGSGSTEIHAIAFAAGGNIVGAGDTLYEFTPTATPVTGFQQQTFTFYSDGKRELAGAVGVQKTGKILIAGPRFANGEGRNGLARFNSNGTLDSLNAGEFQRETLPVHIATLSDGKVYVGGTTDTINNGSFDRVDNVARPSLARLNRNGSLDLTFDPATYDIVALGSFILQPDNSVIISGQKANFDYASIHLDANDRVKSMLSGFIPSTALLRPDGTYLVGEGVNAQILVTVNSHLLCPHLLADGTDDQKFKFSLTATTVIRDGSISDPTSENYQRVLKVFAGDNRPIAVLPNNQFLFRYFDSSNNYHLVRINADGSLDSTFQVGTVAAFSTFSYELITDYIGNSGGDSDYYTLVATAFPATLSDALVLADKKTIVVGEFTEYNGTPAPGIVRLLSNGAVDSTFHPGTGAQWTSTAKDATHLPRIDRVTLARDGKLLITGTFEAYDGTPSPGIAQLLPDGALDTTFVAPVELRDNGPFVSFPITNLAAQGFGNFLLTGRYAATGSTATRSISRIKTLPDPNLANISTRMRVEQGDNALIGGFIVTGSVPKKVLIRAIGPSLPLKGALADPTLELHKADGTVIANDNWKDTQQAEIAATTIPPTNSLESAIVATLPPGGHTAILRGKNNGTGIGLVEVYDLDQSAPASLANISTRGEVLTGNDVMIGGVIITGVQPAYVLVRAIGPSLPVTGALQDPILELHDKNGVMVRSNDNWKETQGAEITSTGAPPKNDKESAIVATLAPASYTAIVRGKAASTGISLVEVYNLK